MDNREKTILRALGIRTVGVDEDISHLSCPRYEVVSYGTTIEMSFMKNLAEKAFYKAHTACMYAIDPGTGFKVLLKAKRHKFPMEKMACLQG